MRSHLPQKGGLISTHSLVATPLVMTVPYSNSRLSKLCNPA